MFASLSQAVQKQLPPLPSPPSCFISENIEVPINHFLMLHHWWVTETDPGSALDSAQCPSYIDIPISKSAYGWFTRIREILISLPPLVEDTSDCSKTITLLLFDINMFTALWEVWIKASLEKCKYIFIVTQDLSWCSEGDLQILQLQEWPPVTLSNQITPGPFHSNILANKDNVHYHLLRACDMPDSKCWLYHILFPLTTALW